MKTSAIVRIVIYSILTVALVIALIIGIGFGYFRLHKTGTVTESVITSAEYISTSIFSAGKVQSMDISWVAGSIYFEIGEGEDISIHEVTNDSKHPMVIEASGSTLKIQDREDNKHFSIQHSAEVKDLYITVPADWFCETVKIASASSELQMNGITAKSLEIDTASGAAHLNDCDIQCIEMNSASGDLFFTGSLNELEMNGASASAVITAKNHPKSLSINGMSGNMDLTLPEDCGFTLEKESLSGKVNIDFETRTNDGRHIYGDGACQITLDGVSASVSVHHGK